MSRESSFPVRVGVDGGVFHGVHTGVGIYNFHLLSALADNYNVDIIIYSYKASLFPKSSKISVKTPSLFFSKFFVFRQLWRAFIPLFCFFDRIDVFFAGNGLTSIFQLKKTILVVHDFVYQYFPDTLTAKGLLARRILQPHWLRRANKIISNSKATARDVDAIYNKPVDAVIKPHSQMEKCSARGLDGINKLPDRFVLVVGTLEPRKNLMALISAHDKFFDRNKDVEAIPLVFVGRSGWKNNDLIKKLNQRSDRYRLFDYLPKDNLLWLYQNALCCWMPSLYEGFGMPLLEARLLGCPIVCSDVPAMREAAGERALFHQTDQEAIYQMIVALYESDFGILKQPDTSGVDWSWDTGAAQLMEVINKVASNQ